MNQTQHINKHAPNIFRGMSFLRLVPALTLLVMLGPVVAGFLGTLAPAFGYLPAVGQTSASLDPFRDLTSWAGFYPSIKLSLTTGISATVLSLLITMIILGSLQGTVLFTAIRRLLSPFLSIPHAAAAFGIAFLISPSGWVSRALSPWLTGWDRPPDLLLVQDPMGIALIIGLVAKEVPFLLLMSLAATSQLAPRRSMALAQTMGYSREAAWLKTIFPRLYTQIRLPVLVVLVFSLSVVDVASILGPNTPSTLSVQIVKWMNDPDLTLRLQAAAGAIVQFVLVLTALATWIVAERIVKTLGQRWIFMGGRGRILATLRPLGAALAILTSLSVIAGLAGLTVWSFAGFWGFPDAWPNGLSFKNWMRHGNAVLELIATTAFIASLSTAIALILNIGCLEAEHRFKLRMTNKALWLLYLPLLIPQTAFLPGLQTGMLTLGLNSGWVVVVMVHTVFVIPYVFLSLSDPFRSWDTRYATVASALGSSDNHILFRIRLPMLLAPILTAAAVGFAVSVGQYLPTLLIGGGRVQTLTTEAVALASGGDRRAIGVYGVTQTLAGLLPFAIALTLPRLIWRNRAELKHD